VVYVVSTPMRELLEDDTLEANVESAKELWDSLESRYMVEDASSKKFLCDRKAASFLEFKHSLKHGKYDLSFAQLGSHLHIEESLRAQESDKRKGKEVDNNGGSCSNKKPKVEIQKCGKTGHFKKDFRSGNMKDNASASSSGKGSKDHSQDQVDAIVWWIDYGVSTHVCKDQCLFKTYQPVEDGYVLYMGDENGSVVLEFSYAKSITLFNVLYVPKLRTIHETTARYTPQQNGAAERKIDLLQKWLMTCYHNQDDHLNDVSSEIPKPCKSKRARKAKSYGSRFQLYLVEGSRYQIGSQYSYYYSIEEDPRAYNEAMQSRDVAFWKEAIEDDIGSIMQ
ncbi:zinc finger, CCHC-type containing protein, partial [Tanacetum coccineum]